MSLATLVLPPELIQTAPTKGRPDLSRSTLLGEADGDPLPTPTMAPKRKPQTEPDKRVIDPQQAAKRVEAERAKQAETARRDERGPGLFVGSKDPSKAGGVEGLAQYAKDRLGSGSSGEKSAQPKTPGFMKKAAAMAGGAIRGMAGAQDKDFGQPKKPETEKPEGADKGADEPGAADKAETPSVKAKPKKSTTPLEEKPVAPKTANRNDPTSHTTVDGPGGQKFTIQHGAHPNRLEAHPQHQGVFVDPTTGKHYAPAGHPIHQSGVHGFSMVGGGAAAPSGGGPFFPGGGGGGGGLSWFNPGGTLAAQGAPAPSPQFQPQPEPMMAPAAPAAAKTSKAATGPGVLARGVQGAFRALDNLQAAQAAQQQQQPVQAAPAPAPTAAPAPAPEPAQAPAPQAAQAVPQSAQPTAARTAAAPAAQAAGVPPAPETPPPAAPAAKAPAAESPAPKAETPKTTTQPAKTKTELSKTPPPSAGADLVSRIGLPQGVEAKKTAEPAAKAAAPAQVEAPKSETPAPKMPETPPVEKGRSLADRLGAPKMAEQPKAADEKPAPEEKTTPKERQLGMAAASDLISAAGDTAASRTERARALARVKDLHGETSQDYKDAVAAFKRQPEPSAPASEKPEAPEAEQPATASEKPEKPATPKTTTAPAAAEKVSNVTAKAGEAEKSAEAPETKSEQPTKSLAARLREFHNRPEGSKATENEKRDHAAAFHALHSPDHEEALSAATGHAREKAKRLARSAAKQAHDEATAAGLTDAEIEKVVQKAYTDRLDKWVAGQKTKRSKQEAPAQPRTPTEVVPRAAKAVAGSVAKSAEEPAKTKKDGEEELVASYNPPLHLMIQEWIY